MKSLVLLLIFTIFISKISAAQTAPCVAWQKCMGGTLGDDGVSIAATPDGGFIVIGDVLQIPGCANSNSFSGDVLVTKWGPGFNLQWQQCISGDEHDVALKIIPVSLGGYLVMGFTTSTPLEGLNARGVDIFITKLDNNGNKLWTKLYGGNLTESRGIFGMGGTDAYGDIIENSDGTFTFITSTVSNDGDVVGKISPQTFNFDVWVVKISSAGNIIWGRCYGGTNSDDGYGITHTSDGGYVFVAETYSNDVQVSGNHGLSDIWLVKINATGILQWQKCMGGTAVDDRYSSTAFASGRGNIITAANGYIYVSASTKSINGDVTGNHGDSDNWVIKMDQSGNIIWKKCYGGTGSEAMGKLLEDADGDIVISGSSNSNNGNVPANYGGHDVFVYKIDDVTGNVLWSKNYGGTLNDVGCDIIRLPQNGYVLTGITRSNNIDVSGNLGGADIWIAHLANTPPPPPVPLTSPVLPVYCNNQPPLSVKLLNPPPATSSFCNQPVNTTITVMLDNTVSLPVAADSTFVLNIPVLGPGSHDLIITYNNGIVQQTLNINFSVTSTVNPQTDIAVTPANIAGIITFSATNVSGQGPAPLYTFANDRNFTSLLQPESSSSTATKLNTSFPVGLNQVYLRLRSSETCVTSPFNIDSVRVPIPAVPQTSPVQNEYCGSPGTQTITLTNIPTAIYQASVNVLLNNIPLTLTGNQFSFTPSALPAGVQQLRIQYINGFITQTLNINFTVKQPITPNVALTASASVVSSTSPAITFTATSSISGTSVLYTFSLNRDFLTVLAPESTANSITLQPSGLTIGNNIIYVRQRVTDLCRTVDFVTDSISVWKNGLLTLTEPGNNLPISVYPNPVSNYIAVAGLQAGKKYSLRITSYAKGALVSRLTVQNQQTVKINTMKFASGAYILTVFNLSDATETGSIKFLRE